MNNQKTVVRTWKTKSGETKTKTYSYNKSRYAKIYNVGEHITKAKRKDYKTEEEWIRATYAKNKAFIDKKLDEDALKTGIQRNPSGYEEEFISYYEGYRDDYKPMQALRQLERSTLFTPYKTTAKRNILSAMIADNTSWETFKELTGVKGLGSIDLEKLKWSKDDNLYVYETEDGKKVKIITTNSPYGIDVVEA